MRSPAARHLVLSLAALLAAGRPAAAEVVSLEVGLHTTCPYGLIP